MPTLFSKIISGELPAYKVAEDAQFLAFLDINPNAKGHTLCIPKVETDKLFDLDEPTYLSLMAFSRKVAMALEQVVSCKRVGMTVIGLEVPHVHVHLIPLNAMEDAQFNKKVQLEPEEFAQLAQSIQEQFNKRA
jgi:histidine triad (HIT) family protein